LEPAKNSENGKEREDCRLISEPSKIRRRFSAAGAEEKKENLYHPVARRDRYRRLILVGTRINRRSLVFLRVLRGLERSGREAFF
ncbi:MAG: hypothetical protein ACYDHW_15425, partial [Syntrophorhabdaceae bacterium]